MTGTAGRLTTRFPALGYRDFRLLWIGQLISTSGGLMQQAAILWHVSILVPEAKGLALGMVGLVRVVPILGFSVFSGVVADAFDRRRLMLVAQWIMAAVALALAAFTFLGVRAVWPVYLLAALTSAASVFEAPARQSILPGLVPREHLSSAVSLNTIMFETAAISGPSLAGLVIAGPGIAWVYVLNAASFFAVIIALVRMRPGPMVGGVTRISPRAAWEGVRFVFSHPLIRSSMLLDFIATFFASAMALLPIYVQDILHVGATDFGWLYAAPAAGSVIASVIMVLLVERVERRGILLLWAVAAYGIATIGFGLSRQFWISYACLAAVGAADTVSTVIRNLIRQLETPDPLRGRTAGVNMVFFMGGPQLGELEAGLVAHWVSAPFSVVTGGAACVLATLWLAAGTAELRKYRR